MYLRMFITDVLNISNLITTPFRCLQYLALPGRKKGRQSSSPFGYCFCCSAAALRSQAVSGVVVLLW